MGHELDRWENEGGALCAEDLSLCISETACGLQERENLEVFGRSAIKLASQIPE
jgi:hypothetical protein